MVTTLNRFSLFYSGRQKLVNNYRSKVGDPRGYPPMGHLLKDLQRRFLPLHLFFLYQDGKWGRP